MKWIWADARLTFSGRRIILIHRWTHTQRDKCEDLFEASTSAFVTTLAFTISASTFFYISSEASLCGLSLLMQIKLDMKFVIRYHFINSLVLTLNKIVFFLASMIKLHLQKSLWSIIEVKIYRGNSKFLKKNIWHISHLETTWSCGGSSIYWKTPSNTCVSVVVQQIQCISKYCQLNEHSDPIQRLRIVPENNTVLDYSDVSNQSQKVFPPFHKKWCIFGAQIYVLKAHWTKFGFVEKRYL